MPRPALIADPKKREIAIAVVMAAVLLSSLLLVWVLTGAPMFRGSAAATDAPSEVSR